MGDFDEKLESILNNPQAMEQILNLAQSLGGNRTSHSHDTEPVSTPPSTGTAVDPKTISSIMSLLSQYNNGDDQRTALLTALRPFVKEKRYAKIDKAIQIAKLSRMARAALDLFLTKEEPYV